MTDLSPRQREVADCLGRGLSYQQTATELGIGEGTVKAHVVAASQRLDNPDGLTPKMLVKLYGAHAAFLRLKKAS